MLEKLSRPARSASGQPPAENATARHIAQTIDQALSSAGLPRDAGIGSDIRATIDQALTQSGLLPTATVPITNDAIEDDVIEGVIVARGTPSPPHRDDATPPAPARQDAPAPAAPAPSARTRTSPGHFSDHVFSNQAGMRSYKLYVPAALADPAHPPAPLLVMLHGCTQTPEDFAIGTGMNALADTHGVLVAYPAQTQRDNGSRCWNWFRSQDQVHGRGEPSLLAGIVEEIAAQHRVDPRRIYVAGLSAGAAMAVILGETYPQLFAAVGAHSGLPYRAAHDVASAFAAMQGQAKGAISHAGTRTGVPTIVFHGDADRTVADRNGRAIVQQALHARPVNAPAVDRGTAPGGRHYTREVHADAHGRVQAEYWHLHGAGHAWSGGSAQGTYTDPQGPDASAEMLRFFLAHPQPATR